MTRSLRSHTPLVAAASASGPAPSVPPTATLAGPTMTVAMLNSTQYVTKDYKLQIKDQWRVGGTSRRQRCLGSVEPVKTAEGSYV